MIQLLREGHPGSSVRPLSAMRDPFGVDVAQPRSKMSITGSRGGLRIQYRFPVGWDDG
jgi:hypothetical protein